MMYNTQRPYAAAYVIFRNPDDHIAFVLRANTNWMNDYYGLPSGKVEVGESFIEAAIRESAEEIGITVEAADLKHVITVHRHSVHKDMNVEVMEWVDVYFEADNWQGEPHNAEPDMHSELAWLDPNNLPENIIPSVRATFQAIQKGEKYFEYGFNEDLE